MQDTLKSEEGSTERLLQNLRDLAQQLYQNVNEILLIWRFRTIFYLLSIKQSAFFTSFIFKKVIAWLCGYFKVALEKVYILF